MKVSFSRGILTFKAIVRLVAKTSEERELLDKLSKTIRPITTSGKDIPRIEVSDGTLTMYFYY